MSEDLSARVLQIRRAHAHARPKAENPAWRNCHIDMKVLFERIDELEAQQAADPARIITEPSTAQSRYEYVRRLNPRQFHELWALSLKGEAHFDDLVDARAVR